MVSLADITSAIDSLKRRAGSSLAELVNDPAEGFAQMIAGLRESVPDRVTPTSGSASDIFHAVANPDAVLGSPVASGGSGFAPLGLAGVMTYHGTPHTIEGPYDLSKVGTGQGAQSYGHGIYVAENPETAKSYRDVLSRGSEVKLPGGETIMPNPNTPEGRAAGWIDFSRSGVRQGRVDPIALAHRTAHEMGEPQNVVDILKLWRDSGAKAIPRGAVYQQDLPDEMLDKFLQWDKLLGEQPPAVRAALNTAPFKVNPHEKVDMLLHDASGHAVGSSIVSDADHAAGAQLLASLGIPGLSYLDQFSRRAGAGTKNHVIWDQSLLDRMFPEAVR